MATTNTKIGYCCLLFLLSVLVIASARRDPEEVCQDQCRNEPRSEIRRCYQRCMEGSSSEDNSWSLGRQEETNEIGEEGDNPYVFGPEHFLSKVHTRYGGMFALRNFNRLSKFLRGIDKYKLALLQVQPERFFSPNHMDADALLTVYSGEGAITVIWENKRYSFRLVPGTLCWLPPGTTHSIINSHTREPLIIVQFLITANNPGFFEPFFVAAGTTPRSFLGSFSQEISEAAFKVPYTEIEKILRRKDQDQGVFIPASKQQIRSLTETTEDGAAKMWSLGGSRTSRTRATFNMIKKDPIFSNAFGQHYEANQKDFTPLRQLDDLSVSFYNISKGAMITPFFDSESINVIIAAKGGGHVEIICPHVASAESTSRSEEEEQEGEREQRPSTVLRNRVSYKNVRSEISTWTAIVVPSSFPVSFVASSGEDLHLISFKVNHENNFRYLLAGKGNVQSKLEKAVKELTFEAREEEVDRVFGNQDERFFMPGPYWGQRRRHQQQDDEPGTRAYE